MAVAPPPDVAYLYVFIYFLSILFLFLYYCVAQLYFVALFSTCVLGALILLSALLLYLYSWRTYTPKRSPLLLGALCPSSSLISRAMRLRRVLNDHQLRQADPPAADQGVAGELRGGQLLLARPSLHAAGAAEEQRAPRHDDRGGADNRWRRCQQRRRPYLHSNARGGGRGRKSQRAQLSS